MKLERDPKGDFFIDPSMLADRLAMDAGDLRRRMRLGLVTSIVEAGDGDDLGNQRLTLRSGNTVWRIIVDAELNIVSEEVFKLT